MIRATGSRKEVSLVSIRGRRDLVIDLYRRDSFLDLNEGVHPEVDSRDDQVWDLMYLREYLECRDHLCVEIVVGIIWAPVEQTRELVSDVELRTTIYDIVLRIG